MPASAALTMVPPRKFICGEPMNPATIYWRPVVQVKRCANLLHPSAAQHDDPVRHGHRFDLIM
jgi:hypothetical protein